MLVCTLLTPPLLCSTTGIENIFPYSPKSAPSDFQATGKQQKTISWVSNFNLTTPSEMRPRRGFESRLRKSHHMLLQVPEQA
jgi:hypothetical protein